MLFNGLLTSLFLEYVNPGSYIPVIQSIKIGTILPLVILIFAVSQKEPVNNGRMLSQATTKWIIFYVLLVVISLLTADVTEYAYKIFKNVLGNVFWFVMIVKLVTDYGKLEKVFAVFVWSHILILILNPSVILQPESRSYLEGAPFLGDGNDFALSVCLVWPMCLILIQNASSKVSKIAYRGALVILILAIIGTQSRGASLALAGSLIFLWWNSPRKTASLVLIAVGAIAVASFAPSEYFQRMQSISDYEQEESAMGRIIAWKSSLRMVKKYPLTGVGAGQFPTALGTEFRPPEWGGQNLPWLTAHSMYFLVLGELGIPGIVCFLSILLANYVRLNRLRSKARGSPVAELAEFSRVFLMLNASLVAFCIGGAFLSVAYYPHIFVLSGLIVAATFIYERALDDEQNDPQDGRRLPSAVTKAE